MSDCNYCERSFDGEDAYYTHLAEEHEDDLSRIDQRRIEGVETDDGEGGGVPVGPAILVGVIGFAAALVVYVLFFVGSGSAGGTVKGIEVEQMPTNVGATGQHLHGPINVTIGGEELDFSRSRFQRQADAFHFERGNGDVWHGHAQGITLEYAMATLGIDLGQNRVTYNGTTYDGSNPGTTVRILVDGQPVDPATYELSGTSGVSGAQQGDSIRIVAFKKSQVSSEPTTRTPTTNATAN